MQERIARDLAAQLLDANVGVEVTGAGVHWRVEAKAGGSAVTVHCFWYERVETRLVLGMNRANARSRLQRRAVPYEGAEFLVVLSRDGARVADGRTGKAADVIACVRAWLGGASLEQLAHDAPFVDEKGRAMRALAARLPKQLRWRLEGDPAYALSVRAEGRAVEIVQHDCAFMLGPATVALACEPKDVLHLTSRWLVERIGLSALAASDPSVELERHALVLEKDPAEWHWLHVRDRLADEADVLAPLRDIIQVLARSPIATKFFSFSSLNRFCFSASSHFPWVNEGLPVIAPLRDGKYGVTLASRSETSMTSCTLEEAVAQIEAALTNYPVAPFFGANER